MYITAIIPARFDSSRLPGKPLADIGGKSMIRRVYEQVSKGVKDVYVATDDERIAEEVQAFGGKCIMTSKAHPNGSSRCCEAMETLLQQGVEMDVVFNVQGDEPLIDPKVFEKLHHLFQREEVEMGTLVKKITETEDLQRGSDVYVVVADDQRALYFSRSVIPHVRDQPLEKWLGFHDYYKHIGIYAFRPQSLRRFASLSATSLEEAEKLEQLRWLQSGYSLHVEFTDYESISVDTVEDLNRVQEIVKTSNR